MILIACRIPVGRARLSGPACADRGGGASGVLAAAHLLRAAPSAHVTVVEPNDRLGAGLAYATADRTHLLNVCAGRMSALADDPGHFLGWLARQGQDDDAGRFVPRRVYGAYLADLLTPWRTTRQPRVRHIRSVCVDLAAGPQGITATLADGSTLCADHAILATGHTLPQAVAQVDPPGPSATAETTPQGEGS
ncbi:FAD/NAD(P)-binding protein [Gemmobacter lanyuensis]